MQENVTGSAKLPLVQFFEILVYSVLQPYNNYTLALHACESGFSIYSPMVLLSYAGLSTSKQSNTIR